MTTRPKRLGSSGHFGFITSTRRFGGRAGRRGRGRARVAPRRSRSAQPAVVPGASTSRKSEVPVGVGVGEDGRHRETAVARERSSDLIARYPSLSDAREADFARCHQPRGRSPVKGDAVAPVHVRRDRVAHGLGRERGQLGRGDRPVLADERRRRRR